jgi:hypothetical protein
LALAPLSDWIIALLFETGANNASPVQMVSDQVLGLPSLTSASRIACVSEALSSGEVP